MCVPSKLLDNFSSVHREMLKEERRLSALASKYDKEVNRHYHIIELAKFNASQGYKLAKDLQNILIERRKVKHEFSNLKTLMVAIESAKFENRIIQAKNKIEEDKKEHINYLSNTIKI